MRTTALLLAGLMLYGLAACSDTTEPAVPTSIEIVDGDDQEALLTRTLPDPLRVRVLDQRGVPLAGARVLWSGSIGPVTPMDTVTDEAGMAWAMWTLGTVPGTYQSGAHTAMAAVHGAGSVTFTGYARVGVDVADVSIAPDEVGVGAGPATALVTVAVNNDYGSLLTGNIRFVSPSGDEAAGDFPLELVEDVDEGGIFEGVVTIPQGAEAGVWTVSHLRIRSTAHTVIYNASALAYQGLAHELTVTSD
jgi:hypothetical protein